jgi:CheY-like chemotaxis protein
VLPVRVLVIEDDADAREGLVLLLEGKGCIVVAACDGAEGLRLARVAPPEVITLDLEMPVMDGLNFRLLQQRDDGLSDIPVIVVSACGARGDIEAAMFFPKPCDCAELVTAVTAHGRRYREEHPAQA